MTSKLHPSPNCLHLHVLLYYIHFATNIHNSMSILRCANTPELVHHSIVTFACPTPWPNPLAPRTRAPRMYTPSDVYTPDGYTPGCISQPRTAHDVLERHLLQRRPQLRVAALQKRIQIGAHAAVEEHGVLRNDRQTAPKVRKGDLPTGTMHISSLVHMHEGGG